MKTIHTLLFGFFAVFLALMPLSKAMAVELSAPQLAIETTSKQLQEKFQDQNFTKNFSEVVAFVNTAIQPHTDFNKISELVLGKNWKAASADEKERFKHEFQTLLVRTYSRAFVEFKNWSVKYLPLDMEAGASKVMVKTEVLQPGLQPIKVDYRMFLSGGEWKAYDIMIEGVSLITNYRTTFSNEIQTKGSLTAVIDGLVKRNAEALAPKSS